jgi:hypothetical protein
VKITRKDHADGQDKNPHLAAIDEAWGRILPHLNRRDPQRAIEEWGRSVPMLHQALACKIEDWLVDLLAMLRTEEHSYRDVQGLNRLIYRIWPEIPLRTFYPEMLKDVFAAMARMEHCMPGPTLDSRAHARADAVESGVRKGEEACRD